jgi:hypothetical protein
MIDTKGLSMRNKHLKYETNHRYHQSGSETFQSSEPNHITNVASGVGQLWSAAFQLITLT